MAEPIRIHTPFTEEDSHKLKIGDSVLITGEIYAVVGEGSTPAFDDRRTALPGATFVNGRSVPHPGEDLGPTPAKPGDPIGSCGPTTSGRMDAYTPTMLDQGIKGMIGKGSRSKEVVDSMKKNGVTYFAAVGGAAALIAKSVKKYEVLAYPELGPEALARLTVEDFPAIVVIDCEGNNLYDVNQEKYRTLKGY